MIQSCAACGFDPEVLVHGTEAAELLRVIGGYRPALMNGAATVEPHSPDGRAWTSLEYAGHMRDVCALFARRIRTLLETDGAVLEVLDHDVAVAAGGYRHALSEDLMRSLDDEAAELVKLLDRLAPDDWSRTGTVPGMPEPSAKLPNEPFTKPATILATSPRAGSSGRFRRGGCQTQGSVSQPSRASRR